MLPTESGNEWECLPPSCRDKGWTWRRVGALCLSWWHDEWSGLREATRSHPHEDKHKAQYCSNKKNDKIQKLIHRIERRHSRLVARRTLVLAVELFEHAWVGTQVTFWQQVSGQPRVQLLPQGFLVRTLYLG